MDLKYRTKNNNGKIIRFLIGLQPFVALWTAFLIGKFLNITFDAWWTLPYIITCIAWFMFSIIQCYKEFDLEQYGSR